MKTSRVWLVLAPLVMAIYGFVVLGPTGRDDSYITYWVAKMIAERGAVLNYNGDRFEQSSSLLHAFLIAVVHRVSGIALPTVGSLLSLVFGAATVALSMLLARTVSEKLTTVVGILLSVSTPLVYWSFSGMESTLDGLLSVSIVLLTRSALRARRAGPWMAAAACLFLLYVTARPEAWLVSTGFLGSVLLALSLPGARALTSDSAQTRKRLLVLAGIAGAIAIAVGLCRLKYSGYFFPLPVYAKSPRLASPAIGLAYLLLSGLILPNLVLYVLASMAGWSITKACLGKASIPIQLEHVLVTAYAFVRIGFIGAAGGDWMEAGRFLVPCMPFLVILSAVTVMERRPRALWSSTLVGVALSFVGASTIFLIPGSPPRGGLPIWRRTEAASRAKPGHPWSEIYHGPRHDDLEFVERFVELLRAELAQSPDGVVRVMSPQAGFVMYYVKSELGDRVRFVDVHGLTTPDLLGCAKTGKLQTTMIGLLPVEVWGYRKAAPSLVFDIMGRCNVTPPDVLFNLDWGRNQKVIEERCRRAGYSLALYTPKPEYACVRTRAIAE
jgi:hypothetical protein